MLGDVIRSGGRAQAPMFRLFPFRPPSRRRRGICDDCRGRLRGTPEMYAREQHPKQQHKKQAKRKAKTTQDPPRRSLERVRGSPVRLLRWAAAPWERPSRRTAALGAGGCTSAVFLSAVQVRVARSPEVNNYRARHCNVGCPGRGAILHGAASDAQSWTLHCPLI